MGIDPGTNLMGHAVIESCEGKLTLVEMGVAKFRRTESHYMRLKRIYDSVMEIIGEFKPEELAIEAPFYGKNVRAMLSLGRGQGVAIAAAVTCGLTVSEYEPKEIKLAATAQGDASKEQVRLMLQNQIEIPPQLLETLELDATDALGVAMCHAQRFRYPGMAPKTKLSASWAKFMAQNPGRIVE